MKPLLEDAALDAVGGRFVVDSRSRFEHYAGKLSLPDPVAAKQSGMFYGRSSAFRRRLWERVGGYTDWLYTAEDTLFALGAGRLAEYKIVYAPASVLYWRPRPTLRGGRRRVAPGRAVPAGRTGISATGMPRAAGTAAAASG